MNTNPRIIFHTGGPEFHPADQQARMIATWLSDSARAEFCDGLAAFERLDDCDLLVLMGTHWTGMHACNLKYEPMKLRHIDALERYVRSGRPLMSHHGAICSYDDCPRYFELLGVKWNWGTTDHSPIGMHPVRVTDKAHPVTAEVSDFELFDELYFKVAISNGFHPRVHAHAEWLGERWPMVLSAVGGRIEGAGKMVYLANGHDLRAFECGALQQLWMNALHWLLE